MTPYTWFKDYDICNKGINVPTQWGLSVPFQNGDKHVGRIQSSKTLDKKFRTIMNSEDDQSYSTGYNFLKVETNNIKDFQFCFFYFIR